MAGPKVMVVNDDTTFLAMMCELLSDEGYDTSIQRESSSAFDAIRSVHPDLVILDIRMEHPESGWTILDLMRLDRTTADIPVIVCSADLPGLNARAEHLRAHGCDILPKPFDINELLDKVQAMVGTPRDTNDSEAVAG